MKRISKRNNKAVLEDKRVYTLDVFLIAGPVTRDFTRKNPVVSRTIQIRGDQTLEDLHRAIFKAFDREEEHMYEFQISGRGPQDPKAKRYVLPEILKDTSGGPSPAGDVIHTIIGSLRLKVDEPFGYWFDFGDDWWHQINVIEVKEEVSKGRYPKIIKRVGASPPQYADLDEEE